jgi:hypothetical protein
VRISIALRPDVIALNRQNPDNPVQFLQFDKISRPLIYTVTSRRDLETQMGFKRSAPLDLFV